MGSNNGFLKVFWAGMFLVCAVLGFVPNPQGGQKWLLIFFSALFFLPPALLVWQGSKHKDKKLLRLIRKLSIWSLSLTVVVLVANMLSVLGSRLLGDILYYILIVVSTPMICMQYWAWSLTAWAILLWVCIFALKNMKK